MCLYACCMCRIYNVELTIDLFIADPLLATQAIAKAPPSTKEVQRQLTRPEKRTQSVMDYTEPPFLQTSGGIIK